jgi:hypothetical protein
LGLNEQADQTGTSGKPESLKALKLYKRLTHFSLIACIAYACRTNPIE